MGFKILKEIGAHAILQGTFFQAEFSVVLNKFILYTRYSWLLCFEKKMTLLYSLSILKQIILNFK